MSDRPESTHWNAQLYDDKHAFVWEHGTSVVQWLGPKAGERILDLGCGTGQLTASIVKSGAEAVGMDSSATMLAEAHQNYPMIELVHADAHEFHFDKPFDAVFSNAVLHWITDPSRVVACNAKALKPGGRLIAEFGGAGNLARLVDALRQAARDITGNTIEHGWYYPTIGQFCSVLNNCQLETTWTARLLSAVWALAPVFTQIKARTGASALRLIGAAKHDVLNRNWRCPATQALLFDRPTKLEGVDGL